MGEVRTEITLVNAGDKEVAERGFMPQDQVRRLTVNALVDTGAWTLVINEETREKLGLKILGTDPGTLADGTEGSYPLAGPLQVIWKDRQVICEAVVLPGTKETLLGAIPLEAMDLMVHPRKEEVVGVHGDQPLHALYKIDANNN
ncbi:MAG: aspartyl protease family protein [Spirochaetaceae bacterium]|nr:aspartyl protease family protein [Spirochaetaceae bacterium]